MTEPLPPQPQPQPQPSHPPRIEVGGAFSYGWQKLFENPGPWILIALATVAANGLVSLLTGSGVNTGSTLSWFVNFVVSGFFGYLLVSMALSAVRGEEVGFPDLSGRLGHIVSYLAATLLYGIGIAVGLVFLIVPGIMFAVAYFYYAFIAVDTGADPFAALREARLLSRGSRWSLFGAGLLAMLVMMLGLLAFGIGILIAIPVNAIAAAHIYQQLRRSPIAP